jgi:hypothetical protein
MTVIMKEIMMDSCLDYNSDLEKYLDLNSAKVKEKDWVIYLVKYLAIKMDYNSDWEIN